MGLAVDFRDGVWEDVWSVTEVIFTVVFSVEMILKVSFLRTAYFREGWNCLDCFLVLLSWVDASMSILGGGDTGLSGLRIIRLLRITRMVRLLKVFKVLWMLIKGIIDSFKTIFWVTMLLGLILYVCSIVCVQLIGADTRYEARSEDEAEIMETDAIAEEFNSYMHFGNMPRAMFTLFNLCIMAEFPEYGRAVLE